MTRTATEQTLTHANLAGGVEFAADVAPDRHTVALTFRMLAGMADENPDYTGLAGIVEDGLAKGTANYTGRALADAFDAIGAQWASASGRQSTIVRVVCLPEYAGAAVDLVAEMIARPTFPDDACNVAVKLSIEERRHMEDDPQDLLGMDIRKLTFGPNLGRYPGGELETLARITPDHVRQFWRENYHAGRLQVAVAGAVDEVELGQRVDRAFAGLGRGERAGRAKAPLEFTAQRSHRPKDLKQQYIAISLPGAARGTPEFPVEQVLLG
ncbi:MAG: insulinase family protein, partial [Phycisphaerales bacterium]|nr:insulinase family protein [Phycisphaerales bacterium]